jgi:hypothetical protein
VVDITFGFVKLLVDLFENVYDCVLCREFSPLKWWLSSSCVFCHFLLVFLSSRGYKSNHPDEASSTNSKNSSTDVLHLYRGRLVRSPSPEPK